MKILFLRNSIFLCFFAFLILFCTIIWYDVWVFVVFVVFRYFMLLPFLFLTNCCQCHILLLIILFTIYLVHSVKRTSCTLKHLLNIFVVKYYSTINTSGSILPVIGSLTIFIPYFSGVLGSKRRRTVGYYQSFKTRQISSFNRQKLAWLNHFLFWWHYR